MTALFPDTRSPAFGRFGELASQNGTEAVSKPVENSAGLQPADVRIEVFTSLDPALQVWKELEACSPGSVYQTRRFAVPWMQTVGHAAGMTPMIIVLRNRTGQALALFPFAIVRKARQTVAEFIGGKDSNANMGLVRHGVTFAPGALRAILRNAACESGECVDIYKLINQPTHWQGAANPFADIKGQESPSQCHSTSLMADPEAFKTQKLAGDSRKKLRYKIRKLGEVGALEFLSARTPEAAERILAVFFEQKSERFDARNISHAFDTPAMRAFLSRTCIERAGESGVAIELHALLCAGKIVATYAGGVHNGRFHAMFNSFESDPTYSRFSPGDVLLSMLLDEKCRAGLHTFDLGIGEGRYKQSWCDIAEPLFDAIIGLSMKGRIAALVLAVRQRLKRAVKQSSWAWPLVVRLRSLARLGRR